MGSTHPELEGPPHGPADDPAQDVAATLVGRQDPVGHQHGHGPGVVGQDPQGHVAVGIGAVAHLGQLLGRGQDGPDQIGVEQRLHPLEHRQVALEAGPGVDVLGGAGPRGSRRPAGSYCMNTRL